MTVFTNIFGGSNISPSEISYAAVSLTANTTYDWALETAPSTNLIAGIMDVTASSGPFVLTLPSALEASTGQAILFNNVGANTFIIRNNAGVQVAAPIAGSIWQIYLTDNTTAGGQWEALQYGAAVSTANAASLAGTGLIAIGTLLSLAMPSTSFGTTYTAGVTDRANTYLGNCGNSCSKVSHRPPTVLPVSNTSSTIKNPRLGCGRKLRSILYNPFTFSGLSS